MERRSHRTSLARLLLLAAIVAGGAPTWANEARTFEEQRTELVTELVGELERLADWCHERKLFRGRDECFAAILHFDPEHRQARRMLRYRKNKDGVWEQKGYRAPKDRGDGRDAFERKKQALVGEFREDLLDLVREPDEPRAADLSVVFDDVLVLDPDDVEVHARLGEVRDPSTGAWRLAETQVGVGRRAELRARLAKRKGPELRPSGLRPTEHALGIDWTTVVETDDVRACGSGESEALVRECVRRASDVLEVLRDSCSSSVHFPPAFTIYVPGSRIDQWHFVDKHPAFEGEDFDAINASTSHWDPTRRFLGVWLAKDEERVERVGRESVVILLEESFGVRAEDGWLQYAVYAYVASALGWPEPEIPYAKPTCDEDAETKEPCLAGVLGKPFGQLSPDERRLARDLVRYLFDGQPEKSQHVFRMIGRGVGGTKALERVLGQPITTIECRLRRWVEESGQ